MMKMDCMKWNLNMSIYAGRLSEEKGILDLLDFLQLLSKDIDILILDLLQYMLKTSNMDSTMILHYNWFMHHHVPKTS